MDKNGRNKSIRLINDGYMMRIILSQIISQLNVWAILVSMRIIMILEILDSILRIEGIGKTETRIKNGVAGKRYVVR